MKMQWKRWSVAVVSLALVLPVAGIAVSQDETDDNDRPKAEARDDGADEPNRDAQRESAARDDEAEDRNAEDRDAPAATDREERVPRSVRREREINRDAVRTNAQDEANAPARRSSPSDLPPADLPPGPAHESRQQFARGYVSQGGCCCGNGAVIYSHNNGYRSARGNNNGGAYRSYSYQGGDEGAVVDVAPAPVYNQAYNNGYTYGYRYGGVQNGANWDRRNEHDSRNFSGSYGSRASLRHGR